jgi:hypothetical protein
MIRSVIFPALVAFSALAVSATAAFYSVTGLGDLFAGATVAVIIMASTLEFSKLIIASVLYRYWKLLKIYLKVYLAVALFVLVVITSTGIYGFLSSAYQQTSNKVGVVDEQLNQVEIKKKGLDAKFEMLLTQKQQITKSIGDLQLGLSNNQVKYKDAEGNILTSTSSSNRKALERQLDDLSDREEEVDSKLDILTKSIEEINLEELELRTNLLSSGEVGSLRYISKVSGLELDIVVNYLILLLVIVFDPLALALVTVFNVITSNKEEESEEDLLKKKEQINKPLTPFKLFTNKLYNMKTTKESLKKTTAQKETPVEKVEQTEVEVTPVVEEKAALVVVAPKVEEVADNQVKLSDIVRIIRQSPHYTEVLLKSGDTAQFSTSDFDKLRNPEDDTNVIRYM